MSIVVPLVESSCKPRNGEQNEQMVSDNEETTQDRRSLHSEAAVSPEDTSPSPLPNDVPYLEQEDDSDEEDQPKFIEFSSGLIGTPNGRILVGESGVSRDTGSRGTGSGKIENIN